MLPLRVPMRVLRIARRRSLMSLRILRDHELGRLFELQRALQYALDVAQESALIRRHE